MVNDTRTGATIVSGKNCKRMHNLEPRYCSVWDASDYWFLTMNSKRILFPTYTFKCHYQHHQTLFEAKEF